MNLLKLNNISNIKNDDNNNILELSKIDLNS